MRSLRFALLFVFLTALGTAARAGGVVSSAVGTARIARASPAHWVYYSFQAASTANGSVGGRFAYPFAGGARLVDVTISQVAAGVGGTSFTFDVQNSGATSLFSTLPVITLASGVAKSDTKTEIALPGGWTRGVLKTDTTTVVSKGDYLSFTTLETGTYSTHSTFVFVLVFEPI